MYRDSVKNERKDAKNADRGDVNKRNYNVTDKTYRYNGRSSVWSTPASDRGDSDRKFNSDRRLIYDYKHEDIAANSTKQAKEPKILNKKIIEKIVDKTLTKCNLELEERKKIRDRYTIKLKNNQNQESNQALKKEDTQNATPKRTLVGPELKRASELSIVINADSYKLKNTEKRPLIKTIKNNNNIYKSVTFVDQKQQQRKYLQVHIPTEVKPQKISKSVATTPTKLSHSSKDMLVTSNKLKHKPRKPVVRCPRVANSPQSVKKVSSPTTEVAKWAPSCFNQHTKPYYEAWVDTTLAAVSKRSKKDKLYFEDKSFLDMLKRSLNPPSSPELMYEKYDDEAYMGKIKVKHKGNVFTK